MCDSPLVVTLGTISHDWNVCLPNMAHPWYSPAPREGPPMVVCQRKMKTHALHQLAQPISIWLPGHKYCMYLPARLQSTFHYLCFRFKIEVAGIFHMVRSNMWVKSCTTIFKMEGATVPMTLYALALEALIKWHFSVLGITIDPDTYIHSEYL